MIGSDVICENLLFILPIGVDRGSKNRGGGSGSCNFPTDSSKFLTEDIVAAQNFNFVPKFPEIGDL